MNSKLLLQKQMVGHYIEKIPNKCNKKVIYLLQGDGLWQIRKNKIGTFNIKMSDVIVPGLETNVEEGIELSVPKIPLSLWDTTLSFFKDVQKKQDTEAYLQFFYDSDKEEYILHCPEQMVGKASVKYTTSPEFESDNMICVMEIHSHGTMSAFFSGTDNADEKDDRFFGVVGKINSLYPETKFRLMLGGQEIPIEFSEIFEQKENAKYPSHWLQNIKKEKSFWSGKGARDKNSEQMHLDELELMDDEDDEWDLYLQSKGYELEKPKYYKYLNFEEN